MIRVQTLPDRRWSSVEWSHRCCAGTDSEGPTRRSAFVHLWGPGSPTFYIVWIRVSIYIIVKDWNDLIKKVQKPPKPAFWSSWFTKTLHILVAIFTPFQQFCYSNKCENYFNNAYNIIIYSFESTICFNIYILELLTNPVPKKCSNHTFLKRHRLLLRIPWQPRTGSSCVALAGAWNRIKLKPSRPSSSWR